MTLRSVGGDRKETRNIDMVDTLTSFKQERVSLFDGW